MNKTGDTHIAPIVSSRLQRFESGLQRKKVYWCGLKILSFVLLIRKKRLLYTSNMNIALWEGDLNSSLSKFPVNGAMQLIFCC